MSPGSEPTSIPRGDAARELPPCDLVMKGGVTSGVVYPGVVMELARKYRFASIGGTSAGAIAAGVCAAAEYGRRRDDGGGMAKLARVIEDLQTPGFLVGLFQPTNDTRQLFEVAREAASSKGSPLRRVEEAAVRAAHRRPEVPVLALLLIAGLATLTIASFAALPDGLAAALALLVALPLALLTIVATGAVSLGLLGWKAARSLPDSYYGICPGTKQDGNDDALTEWLHRQIQACAGRKDTDPPLTFGDLEDEGIRLTMMTTDLSLARPIRVPDDTGKYLFDPEELRRLFPDEVVAAMLPPDAREDERNARRHQFIDTRTLPVLVGVRLSLSFPVLLSAVPLYLDHPDTDPPVMRHLFSDGGIASNFPVHFFDSWFPSRPTFGVDLAEHPGAADEPVAMPTDPVVHSRPRWREVGSLLAFAGQIRDTMQNWRDSMQSELPGFRDRVCQIRFDKGEGGLSLEMPQATIDALVKRGHDAGLKILETFDEARWDQHRFVRYLTLMDMLEENLQYIDPFFTEYGADLARGAPGVTAYREGHDVEWCRRAHEATSHLVALSRRWGPPPGKRVGFRGEHAPMPTPSMRIVPKA
jgi:hypothetical protein